jgi:hypothetical protein
MMWAKDSLAANAALASSANSIDVGSQSGGAIICSDASSLTMDNLNANLNADSLLHFGATVNFSEIPSDVFSCILEAAYSVLTPHHQHYLSCLGSRSLY